MLPEIEKVSYYTILLAAAAAFADVSILLCWRISHFLDDNLIMLMMTMGFVGKHLFALGVL